MKTTELREKAAELSSATNTKKLTAEWAPSREARDVSGPQVLSCSAFLDFTAERPAAQLPPLRQIMWGHLEEPEEEADIVDSSGNRLWYRVPFRDISGAVSVGVPERCALQLANCATTEEFKKKHANGELQMPLLVLSVWGRWPLLVLSWCLLGL